MNYPFQITSFEDYHAQYKKSIENPEAFWEEVAQHFQWHKKHDRVLNFDFQKGEFNWFQGAKLNITENCLDRHLAERGDQIALIWESNEPTEPSRQYTYLELHQQVCRFVAVLRNQHIQKGDRVCIYMPMIPELTIAMLACARIGAIHNVIFGGFSAQAIAERVQDADCKIIITTDAARRGAKQIPMKDTVDKALEQCTSIQKVIVYDHLKTAINMQTPRDSFWQDEMLKIKTESSLQIPAEEMDAEDMLFILYTSGSTGKPKGVVHTTAGYMIWTTYTFVNVFQYRSPQVYFCTADIGWITGHSYIVYGPLCAGATVLMYEGIPSYPDVGRFWDICHKHGVEIFYTSPTAIRSLMQTSTQDIDPAKLASLRVLGTVGEPINEEAWHWYHEQIGRNRCPIVDTWWQTETGGIMISNLASITPAIPTKATLPLPGVVPQLVDEHGHILQDLESSGNLVLSQPWPGMMRTTYGDHQRFIQTYLSTYPGHYFTGDGCIRDADGYHRITGRVDDVLNISGHRIGTAELENAADMHALVVEAAVVGYPHDIKGQGIYMYIVLHDEDRIEDETLLKKEITDLIQHTISPIAKPDKIQIVRALPKTRSGKIMRRILRKIAEGETQNLGDTSTLVDPSVVAEIQAGRI